MYHYRKTRKNYAKHNAGDKLLTICTFCNSIEKKLKVVEEGKTMVILANRVPYDVFEGRRVLDHLMIIPKRHLESYEDFTKEEAAEMLKTAAKYESKGYNVYARGRGNVSRSVAHQHTHLIKTDNNQPKAIVYFRKPHLLIKL